MPFANGNDPANKKHLDEELILRLYRGGLSTNKIAAQLGCHKSLISNIVKATGELRFRTLTEIQRAKAVQLYCAGASAPKIAAELGVTSPAVYLALQKFGITRRKNWDYSKEEDIDHGYFSRIDTRFKAYWVGMFLTDGCVTKGGEIILSLQASDAPHLALWRAAIGSHRKIALSAKPKFFRGYHWICKTARFVIKSSRMAADLFKLGVIPAKTGHTTYPKGIPKEFASDFWRGCVDGDGWLCRVKSNKRQQLVLGFTGDLPVVKAFRNFVKTFTPTQASITKNGDNLLKFQVTDSFAYSVAKKLYEDAPVYLERKHNCFLTAQRLVEA
jgi:transposase